MVTPLQTDLTPTQTSSPSATRSRPSPAAPPPFELEVPESVQGVGTSLSAMTVMNMMSHLESSVGTMHACSVIVQAGKAAGIRMADDMGMTGSEVSLEDIALVLSHELGSDRARVCEIINAYQKDWDVVFEIHDYIRLFATSLTHRTFCTYTLGIIWGVLEAVTGREFEPDQYEVLEEGKEHLNILEFHPVHETESGILESDPGTDGVPV